MTQLTLIKLKIEKKNNLSAEYITWYHDRDQGFGIYYQ